MSIEVNIVEHLRRYKEFKLPGTQIKWRMTPYHLHLSALLTVSKCENFEFPPAEVGTTYNWRRIYVDDDLFLYEASWDLRRVNTEDIDIYSKKLLMYV